MTEHQGSAEDSRAQERRAELIAASVSGDLTPAEQTELEMRRRLDPTIDVEIAELGSVASKLSELGSWDSVSPSPALRERITGSERTAWPRRRTAFALVGAAACLALGAGGALLTQAALTTPVEGPPGTLGAIEHVPFVGQPAGAEIVGDVIAHTWGTETVLEVDGLPVGATYTVVVLDSGGAEEHSGTFLGSAVTINCRMNAAILREDVIGLEVRNDDGAVIATAAMPPVDR